MIRNNSIFISDEVQWYLHQIRRATCNDQGTVDMLADSFLREVLTTRWPQLVELRGEYEQAKSKAAKAYKEIEDSAQKAISVNADDSRNRFDGQEAAK